MQSKQWMLGGFAVISGLLYFYLFYFLERVNSAELTLTYTGLFAIYLWFYKNKPEFSLTWIIGIAVGFRLIPIVAVPALSDDFYRFIWDGRLWAAGINPFANVPIEIIKTTFPPETGITEALFNLLNSPTHYTVYPPIPQFINWVAAKIFPFSLLHSIIVLRISILAAEILGLYFLLKLLEATQRDARLVMVYALNPLVIIELSGNLHHEALMIAFFLGFIYFWHKNKILYSAIMFALAVASKLLPLLFLPYILIKIKDRKTFLLATLVASGVLFFPLLDRSFFIGMADSLTLYYQRFEFNAGLYYLAREVGFWIYGYNAIALIGKVFFIASFILVMVLSVRFHKRNYSEPKAYLLLYLIFCLLSLILHPWYILLLVALAPLTRFKFPIVWSYLIFFTYWGYSAIGFNENYIVVAVEYMLLFGVICYEWMYYERSKATLNEVP